MVSKDFPEQLELKLSFQQYEPTFNEVTYIPIPLQTVEVVKLEPIEVQTSLQAKDGTKLVAGVVAVITNIALSGALQQVWGLVNGL